jgi:hypothetical protein
MERPLHDPAGLSEPPPLAGMCALAALASTLLNQLMVPGLPGGTRHAWYGPLEHAGRFAENLAVFAGVIALLAGAWEASRAPAFERLRRRLFGVVFLTVLMRAVVIATLFERDATTRENVYYAVGAANVLAVLAGMGVLNLATSRLRRFVAGLAVATPLITVLAVTVALLSELTIDPWVGQTHKWLIGSGEAAYLLLLIAGAALVLPRELTARAAFARSLGLFVLMTALLGLTYAQRRLGNDYTIFMYHAQRVDLMLERLPVIYALPIGVSGGAALAAMVAGGARFQGGAALLLILAAGHSPTAPGRLLCMTLGFLLLGRTIASLDARASSGS